MNDDQIRSELERRAGSGSSRPEWVRRDLLPYVRQEIAARPQPVVTSRWAPGLSVAAVIAALLILIVAVPRLAPQPPAASPTPSDSEAFTPEGFKSSFFADELLGATVLVQGRISIAPTSAGFPPPPCQPPNGRCQLGVLDGADVLIYAHYTPTTDALGSGEWAAADGGRDYHFPVPPIEGLLVLRIAQDHNVEFVGLAHLAPDGGSWSVAGAKSIDPNSLGPDDAAIVRGFLVDTLQPNQDVSIDCVPNPFPLIAGLPNRYCVNTDYISDISPNTDFGPNPDRLTVQGGAADGYARNFQGREALYAIAPRLYGGCAGSAPPCWQWDVVARIGPIQPNPAPSSEPVAPAPTETVLPLSTAIPTTPGQLTCGSRGWVDPQSDGGTPAPRPSNLMAPPSFIDLTGLVVSCQSSDRPWRLFPIPVIDDVNDPVDLRYHINWVTTTCDTVSRVTFAPVGDRFSIEIDRGTTESCTVISARQIRIELSRPIDVSQIDLIH